MNVKPVLMDDPIYDEICDKVQKSYPNSCVCYIDRVVNIDMEKRYKDYVINLGNRLVSEKRLFHGTSKSNIRAIIKEGFKASYNKTSAYGIGTYLATRADYSKTYAKPSDDGLSFMFICRAAIGRACLGNNSKQIPEEFDTAVNNLENPTIYVMPNDDSVLPEYVIAFYMNA